MNEKKSMLCPQCRKLISNDEPACPYCGLARPGALWKRYFLVGRSWFGRDPIQVLIIVNCIYYLLSLLINPSGMVLSANPLSFLSPSDGSLFLLGATGSLPVGMYGRWWTLIAASFLHGGVLHLFFNMIALKQLGPFVIEAFGLPRFLFLYIWTGIAGFFLSLLAGVPFTIGASASLCGLIGAILYYGKSRGGFYGQQIYRQAMGWVVGLVLFGLFFPGINNWAHGGGLISGLGLAFLMGYEERRPEAILHRVMGTLSLLLTAAILLWALAQAAWALL